VLLFLSFSMNFRCSSAESFPILSRSVRSFSVFRFCAISCCVGVSSRAARLFVNFVNASDRVVLMFFINSHKFSLCRRESLGRQPLNGIYI